MAKYLRKLKIELVPGEYPNLVKGQVREPKQVYRTFKAIEDSAQEKMIAVYLNTKLEALAYHVASVGAHNRALVTTREIFGPAFNFMAEHLILVHNHPSGNSDPSPEDIEMMVKIRDGARLVEMSLLDFIVVGNGQYWSMHEAVEKGEYQKPYF